MKNQPGYPLPDGELGSDDIVCQLVYLPDRPEYWQAFLGALSYMTTWKAWERDSDKRGKDAAANWRAAFELTMECWRMTCLEQLQDDVAEILAIMQLGNPCCDEMDITDGDQYTDRVEDGVGDVPQNIIDAGYAEDAADWDGFDDYKCMIVHVVADQLSARLNELNELTNEYGAVAGSAAAVFAILAVIFGTGGLAIVFGIVAGVGAVSLLYEALMGFELLGGLADKVDTNHEELACAMYYTDGDEGALAALNDKIDVLFTVPEALILKNLNLGPTLKSLYAGRYDQQDIAEILEAAGYDTGDFDCTCDVQIGEFLIFDDWEDHTYAPLLKTAGYPNFIEIYSFNYFDWNYNAGTGHYIYHSVQSLRILAGLGYGAGDTITINRIKFNYWMTSANAGDFKISFADDTGTRSFTAVNETDYTEKVITLSPPLVATWNLNLVLKIHLDDGTGGFGRIKDLEIDFDASPD